MDAVRRSLRHLADHGAPSKPALAAWHKRSPNAVGPAEDRVLAAMGRPVSTAAVGELITAKLTMRQSVLAKAMPALRRYSCRSCWLVRRNSLSTKREMT